MWTLELQVVCLSASGHDKLCHHSSEQTLMCGCMRSMQQHLQSEGQAAASPFHFSRLMACFSLCCFPFCFPGMGPCARGQHRQFYGDAVTAHRMRTGEWLRHTQPRCQIPAASLLCPALNPPLINCTVPLLKNPSPATPSGPAPAALQPCVPTHHESVPSNTILP